MNRKLCEIKRSQLICSISFILLMGFSSSVWSQSPQGIIEMESASSGLLLPRMTSAQRLAIIKPSDGILVYDLTFNKLMAYNGISWRAFVFEIQTNSFAGPGFYGPEWAVFGNLNAHLINFPPLLGNTDFNPLVLITNNLKRLKIYEQGNLEISKSLTVDDSLLVKGNVDINTIGGQTFNHGPFTVTRSSPSLLTGILTVDKKTLLKLGLEVFDTTTIRGEFKVDNNRSSLFTGPVSISDFTQSPDAVVEQGALKVAGGVGVNKNLNVGEDLNIKGASSFGGAVSFASPVTILALEESNSTSDGALVVAGGTGIGKRLNVGGATFLESSLSVSGRSTFQHTLEVKDSVRLNHNLKVKGPTTLWDKLFVFGPTSMRSSLDVAKGSDFSSSLNVSGASTISNTLNVSGVSTLSSTLNVSGAASLSNTLSVAGDFKINSDKFIVQASTGNTSTKGTLRVAKASTLLGTLTVTGPTKLNNTLTVTGPSTLKGSLEIQGNTTLSNVVNINAAAAGTESNFSSYPLKVKGSKQGIAIAVSGIGSTANNYVSFWDDNGVNMRGRIEGQQSVELPLDPEYVRIKNELDLRVTLAEIGLVSASLGLAIAAADAFAYYTSSTICGGPLPCLTAPIGSYTILAVASVAAAVLFEVQSIAALVIEKNRVDEYKNLRNNNIGVTYQSGAGDYAEYLPMANKKEKIHKGAIVGLKDGMVSLNTSQADKVLVISTNPIILGNMPDQALEADYVKVAFMGQVPVHVIGNTKAGDYILPSGRNDGFARAVHPSDMEAEDYTQLIGMAWSSSDNDQYDIINVGIGLNDGDISKVVSKQDFVIQDLKKDVNKFDKEENEIDRILTKLIPGYQEELSKKSEATLKSKTGSATSANTQLRELQIDEIIEINDPEPRSIIYYKVEREQIIEGIYLAARMHEESGGDLSSNKIWQELMTNDEYMEAFINRMQTVLEDATKRHKMIDKKHAK